VIPSTTPAVGVLPYSPLAGGWLTGRYRKGQEIAGPGSIVRQRRFPGAYDATSPANARPSTSAA
jgi:aryl-alcohol dehydrogenase-like predicted oxidoreductase